MLQNTSPLSPFVVTVESDTPPVGAPAQGVLSPTAARENAITQRPLINPRTLDMGRGDSPGGLTSVTFQTVTPPDIADEAAFLVDCTTITERRNLVRDGWSVETQATVKDYEKKIGRRVFFLGALFLYGVTMAFMSAIIASNKQADDLMNNHQESNAHTRTLDWLLTILSFLIALAMRHTINFSIRQHRRIAEELAPIPFVARILNTGLPRSVIEGMPDIYAGNKAEREAAEAASLGDQRAEAVSYLALKATLARNPNQSVNHATFQAWRTIFSNRAAGKLLISKAAIEFGHTQIISLAPLLSQFALDDQQPVLSWKNVALASAIALSVMLLTYLIPESVYTKIESAIGHLLSWPSFCWKTLGITVTDVEELSRPDTLTRNGQPPEIVGSLSSSRLDVMSTASDTPTQSNSRQGLLSPRNERRGTRLQTVRVLPATTATATVTPIEEDVDPLRTPPSVNRAGFQKPTPTRVTAPITAPPTWFFHEARFVNPADGVTARAPFDRLHFSSESTPSDTMLRPACAPGAGNH